MPSTLMVCSCYRYKDDIFCILERKQHHHHRLFKLLNARNTCICTSSTIAIDVGFKKLLDGKADTTNRILSLSTLRKATYTELFVIFCFFRPKLWIRDLIISYLHSAYMYLYIVHSKWKSIHREFDKFGKKTVQINCYPGFFFD